MAAVRSAAGWRSVCSPSRTRCTMVSSPSQPSCLARVRCSHDACAQELLASGATVDVGCKLFLSPQWHCRTTTHHLLLWRHGFFEVCSRACRQNSTQEHAASGCSCVSHVDAVAALLAAQEWCLVRYWATEMLLACNSDRLEALGETDAMDLMRANMSVAQRARHFTSYVLRSRKKSVLCAASSYDLR